MQHNTRAILAMIASALNHDVDEIYYKDDLAELELTPDRNALIAYMADGTEYKISVEEAI